MVVGAKSTTTEKLVVRDSTFAVIRMEGREMEVVVSICLLFFFCSRRRFESYHQKCVG